MQWEGITAIATSATVMVALGVPLMLWLLTKPKIHLLSASPNGWFFVYESGAKIIGARFTVSMRLRNYGSEKTTITGMFTSSEGLVFRLTEPIELGGHGAFIDSVLFFDLLVSDNGLPKEKQTLHGDLSLEPWGNRRLLFGGKVLTIQVDIPENQGERVRL